MKRAVSILLITSLIFALSNASAFAKTNNVVGSDLNDLDVPASSVLAIMTPTMEFDDVYNQIVTDITDLNNAFIESELCVPASIDQDGLIRYNITYPNGIVNQVKTERNKDGCIVVHFYEGTLHNKVVILKNGNLLVDGQLVDIKSNSKLQNSIMKDNNIISPQMRNEEYSLSPWGNSSDYKNYRYTKSANTCSWGVSTLVGLATGVVATIICSAVSAGLGGSIGMSIFAGVASAMITRCEVYGMEDAFFSWRFDVYERTDSMSIDRYYKYKGACYSKRDLMGKSFSHTYYYRNWFS